jgi:hypothetical protein
MGSGAYSSHRLFRALQKVQARETRFIGAWGLCCSSAISVEILLLQRCLRRPAIVLDQPWQSLMTGAMLSVVIDEMAVEDGVY